MHEREGVQSLVNNLCAQAGSQGFLLTCSLHCLQLLPHCQHPANGLSALSNLVQSIHICSAFTSEKINAIQGYWQAFLWGSKHVRALYVKLSRLWQWPGKHLVVSVLKGQAYKLRSIGAWKRGCIPESHVNMWLEESDRSSSCPWAAVALQQSIWARAGPLGLPAACRRLWQNWIIVNI